MYTTSEVIVNEQALESLMGYAIGAFTGLFTVLLLASLAVAILMIISTWKVFKKAGQAGWKCLIPIYSDYIFYKIAWKKRWFFIMLLLSIAASAISYLTTYLPEYSTIFAIATVVIAIALLVIEIKMFVKLAKAFRKGGGFAVGLILLPFIFMPILAFGSAKYRRGKKRRKPRNPEALPEGLA